METTNQPTKTEVQVPGYLKASKIITYVFYFYIVIGIISLTVRIFLLLLNASTAAGFYQFVMRTSNQYLQPFRGLFPTAQTQNGGYLDVSALFAIVIYLFLLWGVKSLVNYIQNKIDITTARQEQELAEIKRQKELDRRSAQEVVVERSVRSSNNVRKV